MSRVQHVAYTDTFASMPAYRLNDYGMYSTGSYTSTSRLIEVEDESILDRIAYKCKAILLCLCCCWCWWYEALLARDSAPCTVPRDTVPPPVGAVMHVDESYSIGGNRFEISTPIPSFVVTEETWRPSYGDRSEVEVVIDNAGSSDSDTIYSAEAKIGADSYYEEEWENH